MSFYESHLTLKDFNIQIGIGSGINPCIDPNTVFQLFYKSKVSGEKRSVMFFTIN